MRVQASVPACPAPHVRTDRWATVRDSFGVTLRLPPAFTAYDTRTAMREWVTTGGSYIGIGTIASSNPPASLGRFVSPGMVEMTQCIDSIASREALVQTWRTVGGVFHSGRRSDRYDVFAVIPVRADLRVYFMSGSTDRKTQEAALAVLRSITIGDVPPD